MINHQFVLVVHTDKEADSIISPMPLSQIVSVHLIDEDSKIHALNGITVHEKKDKMILFGVQKSPEGFVEDAKFVLSRIFQANGMPYSKSVEMADRKTKVVVGDYQYVNQFVFVRKIMGKK